MRKTKEREYLKKQGSLGYYCIRWTSVLTLLYQYDLVTYHAISAGLSHTDAGLLASIFSLTSIPFSMTIPSLTTRLSNRHRQIMLTVISIAGLLGIAMLLYPNKSFLYWLVAHLLIGTACSALFPYLMVCFSIKTSSPEKTAQLSGLAQTGGYILAAIGPALFGYSFDMFHSWVPAVLALLVIDIIMTTALFMRMLPSMMPLIVSV